MLLKADMTPADYHRVARATRGAKSVPGTVPLRLAVLSSFATQLLEPFIVVEALRRGLNVNVHLGAFGQFEQELSDPRAGVWAFKPDAVVLLMRPEDVNGDAFTRYYATAGSAFARLMDDVRGRLLSCARLVRKHGSAPVLVANFAEPLHLPMGLFDSSTPGSLSHALASANRALAEEAASVPGTLVWDYAGLVREQGTGRWTDPRLWALSRSAVGPAAQPALGAHLARTLAAVIRTPAKCLVLDLDNTLWGGVIGDDGPGGIQLGDDYPGSVFKSFQRHVLGLMDRGILLAVVSKNDHDVVEQTFRTHPDMVIRWDDLACVRANWQAKSENLRQVAKELNIGLDALVLFDDNPVERAEVRAGAPDVKVVDVPADPLLFTAALDGCGFFDQTALSEEDRARTAMYRQERERSELAEAAQTPEEFLRSLEMEAEVGRVDDATLPRVAQLVNKTNQFNLTTRRHSHAEIAAMAGQPDHVVAWLRLRDRFGDQGLVVVAILSRRGRVGEIDTLLMSCRVMNRQVEHAAVAYLLDQARALGCETVTAEYIPTRKNSMVRELYPQLGFSRTGAANGGQRFELDLRTGNVAWPDVIRRR